MKPKQSIRHVPLAHLVDHDANRKLDETAVSAMADSIREHGVLMPLVVTEHPTELDRWLVLDGHHRAAAARLAGLPNVPVIIRHDLDESTDEQLVVMLVANCQRLELSAIDRAEMLGQLRDKQGLTLSEIARRTGLSTGWISESLSLLDLDGETRARVRAGDLKVSEASRVVRQVRAARRDTRLSAASLARTKPAAVSVQAAHFTSQHRLAAAVRAVCTHHDASTGAVRPTVGGIGCGQCWEHVIRADERRNPTPQGVSA